MYDCHQFLDGLKFMREKENKTFKIKYFFYAYLKEFWNWKCVCVVCSGSQFFSDYSKSTLIWFFGCQCFKISFVQSLPFWRFVLISSPMKTKIAVGLTLGCNCTIYLLTSRVQLTPQNRVVEFEGFRDCKWTATGFRRVALNCCCSTSGRREKYVK